MDTLTLTYEGHCSIEGCAGPGLYYRSLWDMQPDGCYKVIRVDLCEVHNSLDRESISRHAIATPVYYGPTAQDTP